MKNCVGLKRCWRKIRQRVTQILCSVPQTVENNHIDWQGSTHYWENRYLHGGNSGSGSYNDLALFKAEIINRFVKENNVGSVIEWGCGDGNQLLFAEYPDYIGLDVSEEAIRICSEKFFNDKSKRFIHIGQEGVFNQKADLVLSLDVIYHLIEDDVYDTYMKRLFLSSNRYVCIYSCNDDDDFPAVHIKHRKFTEWIDNNVGDQWKLLSYIKNKYPYNPSEETKSSWSDFYFYELLR